MLRKQSAQFVIVHTANLSECFLVGTIEKVIEKISKYSFEKLSRILIYKACNEEINNNSDFLKLIKIHEDNDFIILNNLGNTIEKIYQAFDHLRDIEDEHINFEFKNQLILQHNFLLKKYKEIYVDVQNKCSYLSSLLDIDVSEFDELSTE